MALFIMNENYEYDEVTAFLESLDKTLIKLCFLKAAEELVEVPLLMI